MSRTPVYRKIIDHPAAWTGKSIGGKEGFVYQLSPAHLAAIDALLAKTRHLAPQQVTRAQFDDPALNPMLAELRELILNGRGTVIIRGVTQDRYSPEEFERIYWGFGTHWGEANVQTYRGDRLAHVRMEKDNPHARGYRSNGEAAMHTDSYEIVGLMCVERAESGGVSGMVSTLAIHNEIFKNRPELLEPLYRGVPNSVLEARGTEDAVTPYDVPVFSAVDGQVSCLFSRMFMEAAVAETGKAFPPDFDEAIKYFESLAYGPELRVDFLLEPGEMMVWNNFVVLHSRTKFVDSERHQRDLLRLWLNVEGGRPVIPEVLTWANIYARLNEKRMAEAARA